jgi:hypothetical protein
MKTEAECELLAKSKLEEYLNSCECDTAADASKAIQKMLALSVYALELIENGKKEIVQ